MTVYPPNNFYTLKMSSYFGTSQKHIGTIKKMKVSRNLRWKSQRKPMSDLLGLWSEVYYLNHTTTYISHNKFTSRTSNQDNLFIKIKRKFMWSLYFRLVVFNNPTINYRCCCIVSNKTGYKKNFLNFAMERNCLYLLNILNDFESLQLENNYVAMQKKCRIKYECKFRQNREIE
jgi:hypothetical protein